MLVRAVKKYITPGPNCMYPRLCFLLLIRALCRFGEEAGVVGVEHYDLLPWPVSGACVSCAFESCIPYRPLNTIFVFESSEASTPPAEGLAPAEPVSMQCSATALPRIDITYVVSFFYCHHPGINYCYWRRTVIKAARDCDEGFFNSEGTENVAKMRLSARGNLRLKLRDQRQQAHAHGCRCYVCCAPCALFASFLHSGSTVL